VRRNLFSQTQRYIGISVLTILVVQGIRLILISHANPVALIAGLAILLLGSWVVYMIRKRQLSPTVRRFYELEGRRRWPLTVGYVLFWYGGWGLMVVAAVMGSSLTHSLIPFILLVAAAAGWWYAGPRLWRDSIVPKLDPDKRA